MSILDKIIVKFLPLTPKAIVKKIAGKYIAGVSIEDAMKITTALNKEGASVTIDVLGEFVESREVALNEYIDSEETGIEGSFRLDVSSPGVDFPLKFDWQYVRNIGRLLMLRYKDDNGETKNELFRLLDFKNNNLILVKHNPIVKGKASTKVSETIVISKDKILKAVTEVEF